MKEQSPSSGQRTCDLCGSARHRKWYRFRYRIGDARRDFRIERCLECGMISRGPALKEHEIERLYGEDYYVLDKASVGRYVQEAVADYFEKVRRFERPGKMRLLEIGCSRGFLLAVSREKGWNARGVELSEAACRFAREMTRVPVFTGGLEDFAQGADGAPFDLIVALDVIEHVEKMKRLLTLCRNLVAEDGAVLLEYPNIQSVYRRVLGKHWIGFNPYHIGFPTPAVMARYANAAGFALKEIGTIHNDILSRPDRGRWAAHPLIGLLVALRGRAAPPLSGNPDDATPPSDIAEQIGEAIRTYVPRNEGLLGNVVRRLSLGDQTLAILVPK